jgi:hypothetical protein
MRHRRWNLRPVGIICFAAGAIVVSGCASATSPRNDDYSAVPARAEIVCRADGSTDLLTPSVRARPDGVHVLVRSRLDEPATVNGFGIDVSPGRRSAVLSIGPGIVGVACWPYSQHRSKEPTTSALEVVDPQGLYVDPDLECDGDGFEATAVDFASPGPKGGLIPLEEARRQINGLAPDDDLIHGGYPEQPTPPVLVVRDDAVIAHISFGLWGSDWVHAGSRMCGESGLRV